jgi:hypothetical protein
VLVLAQHNNNKIKQVDLCFASHTAVAFATLSF